MAILDIQSKSDSFACLGFHLEQALNWLLFTMSRLPHPCQLASMKVPFVVTQAHQESSYPKTGLVGGMISCLKYHIYLMRHITMSTFYFNCEGINTNQLCFFDTESFTSIPQ